MFSCSDVKMAFYFAIKISLLAITLKAINETRAEFSKKYIFQIKIVDNFKWRLKSDF